MLEQRVQQHFFESADQLYQVAEQLGRPLAFAAQMVTDALTSGHRVLTAGQGHAALEADYLAARLAGRFEQDRPGLAAWSLPAQTRAGLDLSRLLQAQGHPGDVLVVIEPEAARQHAWTEVLSTAHGQEMFVVALTTDDWRAALQDTDLQLRVSAARTARVVETQRVLVHALCDAIDQLLLGSEE